MPSPLGLSIPRRNNYTLDLTSTPTLNRRYGTASPDNFSGNPTSDGTNLIWTGTSSSGGTRECYWPNASTSLRDAEVRSRWVYRNQSPPGQNQAIECQFGHAHRIIDIDGTQASFLSITRNIFGGNAGTGANMNIFNFHWWDQGTQQSQPPYNETGVQQFHLFGAITLSRLLGAANSAVDFPWNVKTRVYDRYMEFIVWLDTDTEPPYGAAGFGGGLEIPSISLNFRSPGTHGIFAGHNQTNDSSAMTNISVNLFP